MLVVALAPMPYGYYTLLRVVVCAAAIHGALLARTRALGNWAWTLLVLAALFNPVWPVHLGRSVWFAVDAVSAVLFAVFAWLTRNYSTAR
jgi:hypothetical protein